ncbi:MAG: hypothetical protein ACFFDK_10075 [Promethearchaeota archaeon]
MMEVPLPKKEEKKSEKDEEAIKKDEQTDSKKESLAARILNLLFGFPEYDPDIHDLIFRINNII